MTKPPVKKFKVPGRTPSVPTARAAIDEVAPWDDPPAIDWSKGDSEESIQEVFERATPSEVPKIEVLVDTSPRPLPKLKALPPTAPKQKPAFVPLEGAKVVTMLQEDEQEEVLGHSVGSPDLIKKALYYVKAASREGGQHPLFDDIEVCLGTAADKMQAYINEMEVR
jgi:hypothetical protein